MLVSALIWTGQSLAEGNQEPPPILSVRLVPQQSALYGWRASQRFVVLATYADGLERDVTSQAQLSVSDPQVAELLREKGVRNHFPGTGPSGASQKWFLTPFSPRARVVAIADGEVDVTATLGDLTASATVQSQESGRKSPISFDGAVAQILTKRGCNASHCHGGVKGREGFKLSLDAINTRDDYDWITLGGGYQVLTDKPLEPRIPRIDLEHPERSLLLQKPSDEDNHGGGLRLPQDSADYQTILNWITAGAPFREAGNETAMIQRLEVFPAEVVIERSAKHQLLVTAYDTAGRPTDMTDRVRYESLNPEIAEVEADGNVQGGRVGEVVVMVRSAGLWTAARIGVIADPAADYQQVSRNNFIDDEIFDKLQRFHIVPSPLSGDAEFLRRVCLDITGTLPPSERVREFITSPDPQKREQLVEVLLNSPEYVEYWTFRFADLFRVKSEYAYWEWVRQSVARNKPYHIIARERISAQGISGAAQHFKGAGDDDVERIVSEQLRVFFGRRMDCAQCHNHPYDRWTQNQFWELAAFFGGTNKMGIGQDAVTYDDPLGHEENYGVMGRTTLNFKQVTHPRTKQSVEPTFLDGDVLLEADRTDPRMELALWMTSQPEFAEATVNRFWGYFFGRGLVEPVDDFRLGNPPTHPVLLTKLARDFEEHHFDLKHLIKRIVLSRTYQLSSRTNDSNVSDQLNYSHPVNRPLDAEVLLDAISSATGVAANFQPPEGIYAYETAPPGTRAINLKFPVSYHSRFLDIYGRPARSAVVQRDSSANLSQALHMLVGSTYTQKLAQKGGRLDQLLEEGAADKEIIEQLYLATLCRFPSAAEQDNLVALLKSQPDHREALQDMLWALISSREFAENH